MTKSSPKVINGKTYSISIVDGKFVGAFEKTENGLFKPVPNTSIEFQNISQSEELLEAYNEITGQTLDDVTKIDRKSAEEQLQYYNKENNKFKNEAKINPVTVAPNVATVNPSGVQNQLASPKSTEIMQYPEDIDPNQDHFKITRYSYVRPALNLSKSAGRENIGKGVFADSTGRKANVTRSGESIDGFVAGDSVLGELKGSILLPMPKVTDVNGVEWGKSELNSSGLTALNVTDFITAGGRASAKNKEDRDIDQEIRKAIASRKEANSISEGGAAFFTGTIAKIAGAVTGSDLDADTFLARQGGKVLNPNAEMLFQGPVIRDFGFSFIMVARSDKEGKMIRKIIKFLKEGMAPKFRSTTFLTNPDVFALQYKSGDDLLNTVNRFSPGGLALTTMRIDYAPNGYWSAYHDSQPVAVKMDLDFTELRPIYEGDQLSIPGDNVGY